MRSSVVSIAINSRADPPTLVWSPEDDRMDYANARSTEVLMATVGDRVHVASRKLGQPPREGVVTGVSGTLLRIKWSTGEESTIVPGTGSVTVGGKARVGSRSSKASARSAGAATRPARKAPTKSAPVAKRATKATKVSKTPAKRTPAKAQATKARAATKTAKATKVPAATKTAKTAKTAKTTKRTAPAKRAAR
jgi:hypothetical protein